MLPRIWKKVLLAICIIACLFNIVSKLVNRSSLEENLKSVNDGNMIWDVFKIESEKNTIQNDTIDGVMSNSYNNSSIKEKNEIRTFNSDNDDFRDDDDSDEYRYNY